MVNSTGCLVHVVNSFPDYRSLAQLVVLLFLSKLQCGQCYSRRALASLPLFQIALLHSGELGLLHPPPPGWLHLSWGLEEPSASSSTGVPVARDPGAWDPEAGGQCSDLFSPGVCYSTLVEACPGCFLHPQHCSFSSCLAPEGSLRTATAEGTVPPPEWLPGVPVPFFLGFLLLGSP